MFISETQYERFQKLRNIFYLILKFRDKKQIFAKVERPKVIFFLVFLMDLLE